MLHLFQGGGLLFPSSCSDAHVFIGYIEILSIPIVKAGFVSRLTGKPLKEFLEVCESRMQGHLAQLFPSFLIPLLSKVILESNRLFMVKLLKASIFRKDLETVKSLGYRIHRCLALALGFFQKRKVTALDPLIIGIVFYHGLMRPFPSHCLRWVGYYLLCVADPPGKRCPIFLEFALIWPDL